MAIWPVTQLSLDCRPALPEHVSLPWDAADELLVNFKMLFAEHDDSKVDLVIGDQYGAISTAFPEASVFTTSYRSAQAIRHNYASNSLGSPKVIRDITCFEIENKKPIVLARIPKQFDELKHLMNQLYQFHSGSVIVLSGMIKHVPVKWLSYLETHAEEYQQSRVIKKARAVCVRLKHRVLHDLATYYLVGSMKFVGHPGVYGRKTPDPGAMALIPFLPTASSGNVCDLGCGNGLLTLHIKQLNPNARVLGIDDNYQAIIDASRNAEIAKLSITFQHSDVFEAVDNKHRFEYVICNPPFHDGHKQLDNIAREMFHQASQYLNPTGVLLVVANSHLPYQRYLRKMFEIEVVKPKDNRFIIYRCTLL